MKQVVTCLFIFSIFLKTQIIFADCAVLGDSANESQIPEASPVLPPELSVRFDSSLALIKNNLLKSPYNWSIEIPYTEICAGYYFSKNSFVELGFDFSYQFKNWSYSVEDFFVQHKFLFFVPVHLRAGYFFYPVSYTRDNINTFSKKTLVQKNLFPLSLGDAGILFRGNMWRSFYWQMSLQSSVNKRETDAVQKLEPSPVMAVSLIYEESGQHFFAGYFQKDFFLEGRLRSIGFGSNLSFEISSWTLSFRGEFWSIKNNLPSHILLTYYFFPSLKWNRISFGALLGGAHHYLQKDQSHGLEYILKGEFYLTENMFLTIERLGEQDSIIKKEAWSFSLRTSFKN